MATNKIAMKFRSITYPNHDSSPRKDKRGKLERMKSFDFSQSTTSTTPSKPTTTTTTITTTRREVSAEGRLRARQFQHTHSASNTTNTLAPGQKLLRFSDECWCSPSVDHGGRPQARSVGCLTSPKAKPGSAMRLTAAAGGSNTVERLVDWQRESPERHASVSPSHEAQHARRSRSKECRSECCCSSSSSNERRNHFSTSTSLPQPSKSSTSTSTTSTGTEPTTPTTPPVSSESRSRRSQFRRAWSLFSLSCDKEVERDRREKSPQQKILRPPTRHFYRRGLSGLPIECSSRYLGLAY